MALLLHMEILTKALKGRTKNEYQVLIMLEGQKLMEKGWGPNIQFSVIKWYDGQRIILGMVGEDCDVIWGEKLIEEHHPIPSLSMMLIQVAASEEL